MISKDNCRQFSIKNVCCRYSLELSRQGDSNEYPQHMFLSRNDENYPSIFIKYPPYLFQCMVLPRFDALCWYIDTTIMYYPRFLVIWYRTHIHNDELRVPVTHQGK